MKYKLLIFDADGTLFDYDRAEKYAFLKTLEESKLDGNPDTALDYYRKINHAIWKEFERGEITAQALKAERFNRLFYAMELSYSPEDFSDQYLFNLSQADFIFEGVESLINDLSSHFEMVILTNGLTKVQRPRFNKSPIGDYFKDYIISEEIGLQKPDPAIFDYTFRQLKFESKKDALMIGDSLHSDILGGINFGIDTCWINSANVENITNIEPTFTLNDIHQLKSIVY